MRTSDITGQLTIFDVLPVQPHVVHLVNTPRGVSGSCWCGYGFARVTDGAELMFKISGHCEPISE